MTAIAMPTIAYATVSTEEILKIETCSSWLELGDSIAEAAQNTAAAQLRRMLPWTTMPTRVPCIYREGTRRHLPQGHRSHRARHDARGLMTGPDQPQARASEVTGWGWGLELGLV